MLLSHCRVLDLTNERGFLCGKILGDLGADVIKIEPPEGEPARHIGPFYEDVPHPGGRPGERAAGERTGRWQRRTACAGSKELT